LQVPVHPAAGSKRVVTQHVATLAFGLRETKTSDASRARRPDERPISGKTGLRRRRATGEGRRRPLGTILGVLASTAGGWWAGREFIRAVRDLDDVDEDLRRRHREEEVFGEWEDTRHAYQLGFLAGRNPGYEGEEFQVFEEELRTAWMSAQADIDPPLAWDLVQKQARLGWDLAHEDR